MATTGEPDPIDRWHDDGGPAPPEDASGSGNDLAGVQVREDDGEIDPGYAAFVKWIEGDG